MRHRLQRLERIPRVPGDADRSLTILRKQIKLAELSPALFTVKGEEGVRSEKFYKSGRRIR
jgi:hypothetical protein